MRTTTGLAPITRSAPIIGSLLVTLIVAACGSTASPPPSSPTPSTAGFVAETPWPPLTDPAKADDVFSALIADGLILKPNGASAGANGKEPAKRIDSIYLGWPLAIIQYTTSKAANAKVTWKDGSKPGKGEPPIAFLGENILVFWGPTAKGVPPTPAGTQVVAAQQLRTKLERLIGPLRKRTIAPVAGSDSGPVAAPTPSGSGS